MSLLDIIDDSVSRPDAIVVHVFIMRPFVVCERRIVVVQPAKREECHKDVLDWFGVVDGACNIPKFHIVGPVRVVLYKTTFDNEFVQRVVVVTVSWDGGIDEGKDLLDTEVAIMEGSAKGECTNGGSASPDANNGRRADEVIPDPWWDVDVVERFGGELVVGGGAE